MAVVGPHYLPLCSQLFSGDPVDLAHLQDCPRKLVHSFVQLRFHLVHVFRKVLPEIVGKALCEEDLVAHLFKSLHNLLEPFVYLSYCLAKCAPAL